MDQKSPDSRQRLSGSDSAFLYLERKEIPLHIACVCIFEEVIPFDEFVATIDSKLHLLPRYREVPVSPRFGIGYPNWEYDRHFDIRRHIVRLTVNAPGGEAELEELVGRLFSQVMNRDKPLWELYVVEGLQSGRGALIAKVHHSLADGIAGASLLRIMLDPTPEGSHAIRKPHFQPPAPPREPSLTDAIASAIHSSLENLVAAEAGLADLAQGLLSERTQQGLQGLATLLPEIARPVQKLPFNRPCGGERKFCWAEFEFADVKAIRNVTGGTVNDVILTVVTRAVAKYTKLHGESIVGRLVRMVCPVSIRRDDQGESLGNQISFLPVTLPLDAEDPLEHLKAVALRTAIMKNARAAELLAIAGSWLGAAPPPAQALFWWGLPLVPLPTPLLNLICTNIPGSPTPLYSVGKRMLSSYPHVPTGYELGVGIAVQSYDGKVCFGLTADAVVCADVNLLRDCIRVSWIELCKAAGVRPASEPSATERRKPAPKKKAAKSARAAARKPLAAQPSPSPRRVASRKPGPAEAEAAAEHKKPAPKKRARKPARTPVPPPADATESVLAEANAAERQTPARAFGPDAAAEHKTPALKKRASKPTRGPVPPPADATESVLAEADAAERQSPVRTSVPEAAAEHKKPAPKKRAPKPARPPVPPPVAAEGPEPATESVPAQEAPGVAELVPPLAHAI